MNYLNLKHLLMTVKIIYRIGNKMKKLICHCGEVELEIKESEGALNKFLRCNCTLCKKK